MMKREFVLPVEICPICGARGTFQVFGRIDDIPYFGETMETLATCSKCNFKHSEVTHLGKQEGSKYEFLITSEEDMKVRVVRSSTGTIKIPGLGVTISPGPGSQGYITNIEGVLIRIRDVLTSAMESAPPSKRRAAEEKLKKIEALVQGRARAKIILMDPFGHSAIVDRRSKKHRLTKREIKALTSLP
ncbi:MAG: ZPR1 zinc finger domain-containing protein [Candidatus Hadarchaeum sp.]|uniref:ZPR1 zinc finger domain-containing protein n=1 Tax=Candidatus Hadarchaeum sp. TaxID=2883567 RepID=UPI003D0B09AE